MKNKKIYAFQFPTSKSNADAELKKNQRIELVRLFLSSKFKERETESEWEVRMG